MTLCLFAALPADDAAARQKRSRAAITAFKNSHPCPSTGVAKARAKCPGYQIDHITPLKCGGADHPDNMQWLSVREHKAKTRREARMCRYW